LVVQEAFEMNLVHIRVVDLIKIDAEYDRCVDRLLAFRRRRDESPF